MAALLISTVARGQATPSVSAPRVEIVGALSLAAGAPVPILAEASPADDRVIVLDLSGHGHVANLASGTLTLIPRTGSPMQWLGPNILWREANGKFTILSGETLEPAVRLPLAHVDPPMQTYAPRSALAIVVQVSAGASAQRLISSPEARLPDSVLIQSGQPSLSVDGRRATRILDRDGNLALELSRPAFMGDLAPGGQRVLVSQGDYQGVANLLTGAFTRLPGPWCEKWWWLPDAVTLVGLEREYPESVDEIERPPLRTDLHVLSIGEPTTRRLMAPAPLQGAIMSVLDVTTRGRILVVVEPKAPATSRTLYLLALRWAQP